MNMALRKLGALIGKDTRDILKNPTMVISFILPVAFIALYRLLLGDAAASINAEGGEAATFLHYFVLLTALCTSIGLVGSMTLVYGIAEEKEKHTLRTLMLANVSAGHIALAKGLVSLAAIMVVAGACFAAAGTPLALLAPYLALCALGSVPVILLSLVLGMASRDQMTAGLYSMPIVIVAVAPIMGVYDDTVGTVVGFLPTGGIAKLLELSTRGCLWGQDALLPLGVTLAWIVAGVAVYKLLYLKLARDN